MAELLPQGGPARVDAAGRASTLAGPPGKH